jgi:hypothetical protein
MEWNGLECDGMEWNGIENSGKADAIIRFGGMRFRSGGQRQERDAEQEREPETETEPQTATDSDIEWHDMRWKGAWVRVRCAHGRRLMVEEWCPEPELGRIQRQ